MTTDEKLYRTQKANDTHTIAEWIALLLTAMNQNTTSALDEAEDAIEQNIQLADGQKWWDANDPGTTQNLQRCITAMERILQREYMDGWEFHINGTPAGAFSVTIDHNLSPVEQSYGAGNKPDGNDVMKWFGCVLVNSPSRSPKNYDPELSSGPHARKAVETFDCYQDARQWYDEYSANVALVPYSIAPANKRGFLAMKTKERSAAGYAWS